MSGSGRYAPEEEPEGDAGPAAGSDSNVAPDVVPSSKALSATQVMLSLLAEGPAL